ncbi:MAG: hypothetical protein DMF88_04450, partial [Acidobacteria bacterium]
MALAKFNSSSNAGFSLIESLIAVMLMAGAIATLAQLFALSTRTNVSAHYTTFAAVLAEQKLEELRALSWGFDTQGLPMSDTSTDTTVSPETAIGGTGLQPSPSAARHEGAAGRGRQSDVVVHRLHTAVVDHAAADEPEQHAGHSGTGHAQQGSRPGRSGRRGAPAGRGAHDCGPDKEGAVMAVQRTSRAGFTLVEMLVATLIMVAVTGAIFSVMNPAQGTYQTQPEVSDMQQRMRIGVDSLTKDIIMAGAGTYMGANAGALYNYFAPIMPYRSGDTNSDPSKGVFYRADTISLMYV